MELDELIRRSKELRNRTRKTIPKTIPKTTSKEEKKVFQYLEEQLAGLELRGMVVSLLVYDARNKRINCYGDPLPPELIFQKLNLTINTAGTQVTGTVSYPQIHRLTSYYSGYFVSGKEFDLHPDHYLALINIPINPDSGAVKFP